jgi:hypothetical protein
MAAFAVLKKVHWMGGLESSLPNARQAGMPSIKIDEKDPKDGTEQVHRSRSDWPEKGSS